MTGWLHQIHVDYVPAEDRALLKFNTMDRQELRFWLTRRFAKSFWDSLQQLLADTGRARAQPDPALRKAMVGFEQEEAAPAERFGKAFADAPAGFPLGEEPVLLTRFTYKPAGKSAGRTAAAGRPSDRAGRPAGRAGSRAAGRAEGRAEERAESRARGQIVFETASGHEIGLPADATLLHSLSRMLVAISKRTDWDLALEPGYALGETPGRSAPVH
jgi:hypothetical protein